MIITARKLALTLLAAGFMLLFLSEPVMAAPAGAAQSAGPGVVVRAGNTQPEDPVPMPHDGTTPPVPLKPAHSYQPYLSLVVCCVLTLIVIIALCAALFMS